MPQTHEILRHLEEKKRLFLEFEQETEQMCFAPINEIEKHMQIRLDLQEQIEDLDEELQALYDQLPGAREAASHAAKRQDLSEPLGKIYDLSMQVKAVVHRIMQNEPMILERIQKERAELLKKLESTKQSSASVAQRYHQSMSGGVKRPYIPPAGRKI